MADAIIIERESVSPGASYITLVDGEDVKGGNLMIRNTTTNRMTIRIGGDDSQIFTAEAGEKFVIGISLLMRGKIIEVKEEAPIAASVRANVIG